MVFVMLSFKPELVRSVFLNLFFIVYIREAPESEKCQAGRQRLELRWKGEVQRVRIENRNRYQRG